MLAPYFGPVKRWVWFLSTAPRVGHRPFAPWAERIREKRQPRAHPLLSTSTTFRCQQLGLAIKTEVLGLPPMAGDNTAIVCDSQHLAGSPEGLKGVRRASGPGLMGLATKKTEVLDLPPVADDNMATVPNSQHPPELS